MKYNQYMAIIFAGSLAACGGGSGSSTTPTSNALTSSSTASSIATMQKTTVAQGMVTGFGSVIVNGVHYDVGDAAIDVDGDSNVESDLGVGQMVRITATMGDDGRGKASKLEGESQLRGPIDSIDLVTGTLVALGQTVIINADTFYQDGLTADLLKAGDIVKVSAYTNADGALVATRIEVKVGSAAEIIQLVGQVADLDTTAMTFTLNGKTIDYTKATINDLPNKTIANGMLVRVRGSIVDNVFVAIGNVHASPLDIKHNPESDDVDGLAVGGLVSDLTSTSFALNDVTVLLNEDTEYKGGLITDLVDGLLVKVHGVLDADKNLVAAEVRLILQPKVEDNGLVQTVDLDANTFTVNGVTFTVTVDTSFNDGGRSKVRLFSLKDLAPQDVVNVRGYKVAATETVPEHMVATRVERHNAPAHGAGNFKVQVHGIVETVVDSTITVEGHSVTLNDSTTFEGFDSLQAFLTDAKGLNVEIKGAIVDNVFVASKVELDDESEHPCDDHHALLNLSSMSTSSSSAAASSAGDCVPHNEDDEDAPHSFSSRSAGTFPIPPRSLPARSDSSMMPRSEPARSESSRAPRSEPARSESSRAPRSESAHSESSRAPRSEPAHSESSKSSIKSSSSKTSSNSSAAPVSSSSKSAASSSSAALADAVAGKAKYDQDCASCHGGKGTGPFKISPSKTVYDGGRTLAAYITAKMPQGNIGSCNTQCGQDIAAYIKTW